MPTGFPDYYGGLTIPVTVQQGGTGKTTITSNALLLGNGTGNMVETNVGAAYQVLQVPSGGGSPAFADIVLGTGKLTISANGVITKYNNITTTGNGVASIVAAVILNTQAGNVALTPLYSTAVPGLFRVSCNIFLNAFGGGPDSVVCNITWAQNGVIFTLPVANTGAVTGAAGSASGDLYVYADGASAIQFATTAVLTGGDSYDLHLRVEAL